MKVALQKYQSKYFTIEYALVMSNAPARKRPARRTRKRTSVTIEDPRAIRALAHEVRQQVIEELYDGEVLTATQAARLCGITPSAMSYHLRALEKWGIVRRDDPSVDGRERPWRAAGDSLTISANARRGSSSSTATAFMGTEMASLRRTIEAWSTGDRRPEESAQVSRGRMWLTDAEARSLNDEIESVIEHYDTRTAQEATDEVTARDFFWLNLPQP